jgi:hypothetical protein
VDLPSLQTQKKNIFSVVPPSRKSNASKGIDRPFA